MSVASIRLAGVDDLPGLLDLYADLHPGDLAPDAEASEAAWSALLAAGIIQVWVAEIGGTLAASCTLTIVPNLTRGCRSYGLIENVVTLRDYRRTGLGTEVLNAALSAARKIGCYKVSLATGSRQPSTLRFYEAAGFRSGGKTYFEIRFP